jgi:NADH:ubiquinone oxidoreductase subunit F (NADH-binding)
MTSTLTGTVRLPRLLAGIPLEGQLSLDGHLEVHGALPMPAKRRRKGDIELIDEIQRAGLKGRGGAGFPTALKMHAVLGARKRASAVVVNATEGEPASFKDRTLMRTAPQLVLDGAVLAAHAVAAGEVIVCVSEASPETARCAQIAISERERSPGEPPMRLVAVPHTYVSGQESALVNFLNGGPAKPTFTPPMMFERGVAARPTMLSNAETFAHVALIARHGADWFRALGTPEHAGSALVTLSGPVAHPGVYEVEHGSTLRSLIDAAGGLEEDVRAILIGGYAGSWIDASQLDSIALDDTSLAAHQATIGAGVVCLLSMRSCPVAETVRVAGWLARESAGQCGPCVHGLDAVVSRLQELALGSAGADGVAQLGRLSAVVRGRGACRHPDGAVRFVMSATEVFAEEFADHARHGQCPACSARPTLPLPRLHESPRPALQELAL